jgi:hypothetical protein
MLSQKYLNYNYVLRLQAPFDNLDLVIARSIFNTTHHHTA